MIGYAEREIEARRLLRGGSRVSLIRGRTGLDRQTIADLRKELEATGSVGKPVGRSEFRAKIKDEDRQEMQSEKLRLHNLHRSAARLRRYRLNKFK